MIQNLVPVGIIQIIPQIPQRVLQITEFSCQIKEVIAGASQSLHDGVDSRVDFIQRLLIRIDIRSQLADFFIDSFQTVQAVIRVGYDFVLRRVQPRSRLLQILQTRLCHIHAAADPVQGIQNFIHTIQQLIRGIPYRVLYLFDIGNLAHLVQRSGNHHHDQAHGLEIRRADPDVKGLLLPWDRGKNHNLIRS